MSNHFHLMISTPDANIDKIMLHLMTRVSLDITKCAGRINQTFGGPYHSSIIRSHHYFLHAYKYVYRNPVEEKMSNSCESYTYSTLNGLLGFSRLEIPLACDEVLFPNVESTLDWINRDYLENHHIDLRKGFKRPEFGLGHDRKSRQAHVLELELS